LQEVSHIGCDVGLADNADDVKQMLPQLFAEGEIPFDYNKIDASYVVEGWNSKVRLACGYSSSADSAPCRKGIGHMSEMRFQNVQQT
jgi:hypothetical protein